MIFLYLIYEYWYLLSLLFQETVPIDKLQVIHRYRPSYHGVVEDKPETGKVQNYTRHVGSVLKSQDYVNYYIKEGRKLNS